MSLTNRKNTYDFSGKMVLITGGASGIGLAAAKQFSDFGAQVFVIDKDKPSKNDCNNIKFLQCDIANHENLKQVINHILEESGNQIDYLFTNAGVLLSAKLIDSSVSDINQTVLTNLNGTIYTLKYLLPIMVKQNEGAIVLMGSDQSLIGKAGNSVYGCTKAAIAQLAKSLAVEYAEHNIRVNCVCPGTIDTPFVRKAIVNYAKRTGADLEQVYHELVNAQPIKRMGTAEEVANVVLFLSSDLASYITGALISVDGGYTSQ